MSDRLTVADVLADWVQLMGPRGAVMARSRMVAPWGVHIDARREVVFHIVLEGGCWLRHPGAAPLRLAQGDLVLLPHGDAHDLVSSPEVPAIHSPRIEPIPRRRGGDGPVAVVVCGVYGGDVELSRPMLRELPPVTLFAAQRIRDNPQLASALGLLIDELERPGAASEVLASALFDALFLYVARAWAAGDARCGGGWFGALRDPALARALARMHAEPASDWTVERLARVARVSRATFARRFHEQVGEPPLAYLTRWRMGLAAKLLVDTDASLAAIAGSVGYDSEFAFSRAFKRHRGVAPTAYRRSAA